MGRTILLQASSALKGEITYNAIAIVFALKYNAFMNAILTVVGKDQVGIISKVSNHLAAQNINIIDITQTILSGNFVMMMMVDLSASKITVDELRTSCNILGQDLGVEINIMHEKVFSAMHRI